MIAKNFVKYPEALRFQREMFSNGYHNSPRIMRLMECVFDWSATVPDWWKEAKGRARDLARRVKKSINDFFKDLAVKASDQLNLQLEMPTKKTPKYKLNISRDVDKDEPGVYILNLPAGFKFDEHTAPDDCSHVRGYDSMKELRADVKNDVVPCTCSGCIRNE